MQSKLRLLFWVACIVGPISTALAFMDIAAHSGDPTTSPMIGLEGGGAPNALPFIFITVAFVSITGALFARSAAPESERPSIPRGVATSLLVFVITALVAGPIFRAKWRRDCAHDVARACWAVGELSTDPAAKASLLERACDLGDTRGCPSASPSSPAPSASSP